MSYDTDPALYNYAPAPDQCATCYDPGITPDQIFIGVGGMIKGPLAAGGDPPPPNGVFQLDVTAPCSWSAVHGPYTFTLKVAPAGRKLEISLVGVGVVFLDPTTTSCLRFWANIQQNPAIFEYNFGLATLANPLSQDGLSIADLQSEIGLPPAQDTFVNLQTGSPNVSAFTIRRQLDASRLKISIEDY